jgi:hypothetical protein
MALAVEVFLSIFLSLPLIFGFGLKEASAIAYIDCNQRGEIAFSVKRTILVRANRSLKLTEGAVDDFARALSDGLRSIRLECPRNALHGGCSLRHLNRGPLGGQVKDNWR